MDINQLEKTLNKKQEKIAKEMAEAGVFFGHSKSKKDPRMDPYISTFRGGVYIIDLVSSVKKLEEALDFIKKVIENNGIMLFVGTQPQIKETVKKTAEKCHMPYIIERWLGGTLTNFQTIYERIKHLRDLEQKKKTGELEKYTKKEQLLFNEEIKKLNRKIGGIKTLDKLPDAIFVLSVKKNQGAVKEAKKGEIPVIGLVDTNANPVELDYPIPANDDGVSSLKFILEKVEKTITENKPKIKKQKTAKHDKGKSS